MLGVLADSLNHLVFTMPFQPSEGEEAKLLINQQMKDVLIFHYLPILWYRYPIPNDIREFWYNERPDILDYMQKAYQDFNIQFLPDRIVKELNQKILTTDLTSADQFPIINSGDFSNSMTTELLSSIDSFQADLFFTHSSFLNVEFYHTALSHVEKVF